MLLPSLLKSGDQVYQKVIKQLYQKMLLLNLLITITFVMKKDENSVKVITVTKFIIMTLHLLTTLSKTKCTENYINF